MAKNGSVQKFFKLAGTIAGLLVIMSAVVAGVIETRVKVNYVQEDVQTLEVEVGKHIHEHEGKVKVLERRTDDLEKDADRQGKVLDDIKDALGDLHTEQKVQGQYIKSFIEEYRRERKENP